MVVVEAEIAAQRFEISRFQRLTHRILVGQVAANGLDGTVDQQRCVITLHGKATGDVAVFVLEGLDESLAARQVEIGRPGGGAEHAECGFLLRRQGCLIDGESRQEGHLVSKAGIAELLDETHAHAARHEGEQRFGAGIRHLGDLGGEVVVTQRCVDLVDDVALVVLLKAGHGVTPGLVVGRHHEDALDALVLGMLAEHFEVLVVLIGRREEIRAAISARQGRRPGIGG